MPALKNNANGVLASSITAVATTMVLQSGTEGLFPLPTISNWSPITVVDASGNMEIMRCTNRTGVTLTVVRAQEGTTALSWVAGARISHRLTAGVIDQIQSQIDASDTNNALAFARRLRVDAAQSLNAPELAQAEANLNITAEMAALRLNGRLGTAQNVTNWDTLVTSVGRYSSNRGIDGVTGTPDGGAGTMYWIGEVVLRFGIRPQQTLEANPGDPLSPIWRRNYNGTSWGAWYPLQLSQTMQDARYAQFQTTTSFTATQLFTNVTATVDFAVPAANRITLRFFKGTGTAGTVNARWHQVVQEASDNWQLYRFNAAGVFIDAPFAVDWATGLTNVTDLNIASNKAHHDANTYQQSGDLTLATAGALSFTHSLGRRPSLSGIKLKCVIAEHGYAVGDVIERGHTASAFSPFASVWLETATETSVVNARLVNQSFVVLAKTTGVASVITNANWRAILWAGR